MNQRLLITLVWMLTATSWCGAEEMATLFTDPVVQSKAIDGDARDQPGRRIGRFEVVIPPLRT